MPTLAIVFDPGVDPEALERLFAAVVLTLGVTGSPRFDLREVSAPAQDDALPIRRWRLAEGPGLTLELLDDRSLGMVWAAVEGEDGDRVRAVDQRLRALLPATEPGSALAQAVADPRSPKLLHRAALSFAGRGEPPPSLRALVTAAIGSRDRDRVFAACVAAAQLKDREIDAALRAAAQADPGLRQIVAASVR